MKGAIVVLAAIFLALPAIANPQDSAIPAPSYQPKFVGDKAHSEAEAGALGYMRTVVMAQKLYKKKHDRYAKSLMELVGSGSFTRRMVDVHRGDYTVNFKAKSDGYVLALTPKQYDSSHRAFYVDESGVFRGEENGPATASSPLLQ